MIKVVFVCHGNICRSPMAEFLFKDYVKKMNCKSRFLISSCATSKEEIGNKVHYKTREILNSLGIDCSNKRAVQICKDDYEKYDFILAMDKNNVYNLKRILGEDKDNKIHLLLEYAGSNSDISDPWYTGDFKKAYEDINLGIKCFFNFLIENGLVNFIKS